MNVENYPPKKITLDYEEYLTLQEEYEDISKKLEDYKKEKTITVGTIPMSFPIYDFNSFRCRREYKTYSKDKFLNKMVKEREISEINYSKQIIELDKEILSQKETIKKLKGRSLWKRIKNSI